MGLIADIGKGPVAIDTSIFIYYIESNRDYLPLIEPLFLAASSGQLRLVTSVITLLEILVVPFRAGHLDLARRYEELLTMSRGLDLIDVGRGEVSLASRIRARFRVATPDALQLAVAVSRDCTSLVTNDRDIPSLSGLPVLQLNRYLKR